MRNQKGFTLIELMIVVVIIGILAAVAIPRFIGIARRARVKACVADVTLIRQAVGLYITDHGEYPTPNVTSQETYIEFRDGLTTYVTLPTVLITVEPGKFGYTRGGDDVTYDMEAKVRNSPLDTVYANEDSLWDTYTGE